MEIHGVIQDWVVDTYRSTGFYVARGTIVGDTKGRWEDGHWIRTSAIMSSVVNLKEGDIIQTRNSNYILGRERRVPEETS